ncbi:MAG: hypothetical protein CME62_03010 [Halobacteriovoraceae bacterium]|nr:hypothetical protein [Halobacteriovoraceae bacterium]|tara:strand:+ start:312 stop:1730 length:1419 start_codon:yes stop_codon:yes gene_type:complete
MHSEIELKGLHLKIIVAVVIVFVLNAIQSVTFELSYDEAYYWIYSQYLAWGYFDHPPMVALFIKIGTLLFGHNEFGVRFMFNLASLGSFYLILKMTGKKYWALVLLTFFMMPLLSFSGLLALPDTPLLFFTTLFFYYLQKYIDEDNVTTALLISLTIAAMFYSKYHGLLIILLTIMAYPKLLKRKSFYAIALGVVLLYLPHMYWQYTHDFVSFKFHLTGRTEKHFDLMNIINFVTGQIVLLGVFNFFLFLYLFYKNKFKQPFQRILLANSLGFLLFLLLMSFRNQIEANWSVTVAASFVILFVPLIFRENMKRPYIVLSFLPLGLILACRIILFSPESFEVYFDNPDDPDENRINEIIEWKNQKIPEVLLECEGRPVVADSYQVAAKLSFYLGLEIPALHLDSRESQYSILKLQKKFSASDRICFLTSEDDMTSVKIETNFKDPIFVVKNTSLAELASYHGLSYEKVIRSSK